MSFEVIAAFLALPFLGTFAYASMRGAPWVPTRQGDVNRFLALARIQTDTRVVDLGCGNGRMLAAATRAGAHTVGYDVSLFPYLLAKFRSFRYGGRMRVRFRDFWGVDCSEADLVYCFLMPKVYPKLKRKLERELAPGARVILYVWPMDGWEPDVVDERSGSCALYRYTM